MPLLDIRHLTIEIETPQGLMKAVDRMSLTLNEGKSADWWANQVQVKAS